MGHHKVGVHQHTTVDVRLLYSAVATDAS